MFQLLQAFCVAATGALMLHFFLTQKGINRFSCYFFNREMRRSQKQPVIDEVSLGRALTTFVEQSAVLVK